MLGELKDFPLNYLIFHYIGGFSVKLGEGQGSKSLLCCGNHSKENDSKSKELFIIIQQSNRSAKVQKSGMTG